MSEYTYTVEKPCPVCGEKTHVTKLKARLITLSTDEDFCVHYQGVNPYRYRVWLCEHCGFAADEKQFADEPLNARDKAKIQELMEGRKINLPYTEERLQARHLFCRAPRLAAAEAGRLLYGYGMGLSRYGGAGQGERDAAPCCRAL